MFWVWRCYGLIWTLHCHKDRYCDVTMIWPSLFHGIRANVSETLNKALAMRMHGDYRPSIERFFVGFKAICYAFLRYNPIYIEGTIVVLAQSQCYSINARAFVPRTPYRVGVLAGDVMRAWVSHSLVIIGFITLKLHYCLVNYIFVLDKRNTAWLRNTVRQTSLGKSAAMADLQSALRPLTSLVCLTVSRNHAVFLLYMCCLSFLWVSFCRRTGSSSGFVV